MGKMVKHLFRHIRWAGAMRLLLLAGFTLGLGIASVFGDQQTPKAKPKSAPPAPASVQKKTAAVRPAKTPKASAEHKSRKASSPHMASEDGKRDPFKLPPAFNPKVNGGGPMESAPGGALPPGVRGLLIAQLRLEGVVREQTANKMIAVVTNDTRRAYFLTENESVYNGVVSKITPDAIYFKENVLDANGRVTTREVMKRLGSAPGEAR
jgi:hypothetical protein